jgi:DNA-binding response OmpR family regulator
MGSTRSDAERVLVVEDEPALLRALEITLRARGYRVVSSPDGRAALTEAARHPPDAVLLDLGLPDLDGTEVIQRLRAWTGVPVLVLSGRGGSGDKIGALDAGADDYVTKPFGLAELRSRIRAVLRRAGTRAMGDEVLVVGPISLDRAQREVMIEGTPVKLTFSEFELLDALMADPGRLLNRQELLRAIWGDSAYRDPRAIDVHIRHLREKLEPEPEKPRYILTVRGAGYRLRGP